MFSGGADQGMKMFHWFHVQNQHTDTSAANSTATMSVAYRQRLNGPNVKSTSGSTAGCSEFVVLLRGPGEQPGSARAEQHTNIRGAAHHRRGAIRSYNSPSLGFWTNSVSERAEVIGRPAAAAFSTRSRVQNHQTRIPRQGIRFGAHLRHDLL